MTDEEAERLCYENTSHLWNMPKWAAGEVLRLADVTLQGLLKEKWLGPTMALCHGENGEVGDVTHIIIPWSPVNALLYVLMGSLHLRELYKKAAAEVLKRQQGDEPVNFAAVCSPALNVNDATPKFLAFAVEVENKWLAGEVRLSKCEECGHMHHICGWSEFKEVTEEQKGGNYRRVLVVPGHN